MKKRTIFIAILLLAAFGCDKQEEGCCLTITGGASPVPGSAIASATCGQNGASLTIFCQDQSSDPQNLVVDENGVSFKATLTGTAQSFIKLGDLGQTSIIDVTNGGPGVYLVAQNLIGKESGSSIASNEYSVIVSSTSAISAAAVRLGYVAPEDEAAFTESLDEDGYGLAAVMSGLISAADAELLAKLVYFGLGG